MPDPSYQINKPSGETPNERWERLARFYATLMVLTPRVWVTPLLIAANVILFVLMVAWNPLAFWQPGVDELLAWGANLGPRTLNGQWWRLFTCMFLHVGILHLGINMWVLWDIGRLMERVVGNVGFILLYVVSGLLGSLASVAWNSQVVSAGASGAVFGLIGGLLGFLVLGRGSMPTEIATRLGSSALTFVVFNLFIGLVAQRIDNAAHIGGLLGGCLCGLILGQPLTLQAGDWRWPRNLAVLVVGGSLLAGGMAVVPKPPDLDQEIRDFLEITQTVGTTYETALNRYHDRKLTADELADVIERDVLGPWQSERIRLEKLQRVPQRFKPHITACANYARLQEEVWELQAADLRERDSQRKKALEAKDEEAKAAAEEVKRILKPA